MPRLAVLIPAYNAEAILPRALASLAENREPHDIIVVDDGSKIPLATSVAPQKNLVILRTPQNLGIAAALNLGLNYILSRDYEYVARLDADDIALPERLEVQRAFMDAHKGVALAGSAARIVSEKGEILHQISYPTDHDAIVRELFLNCCFFHPSLIIRLDVLRDMGLYDESFPPAEDYELERRIAKSYKVANIPLCLIDYTVSMQGITQSKWQFQNWQKLRVQWRYRDLREPRFYVGILKTIAHKLLPVKLSQIIAQRKTKRFKELPA